MSKIKILPEILSNKIAAGEVVERPASVVKELIENSIDAKSTKIIIEIEKGGRALIRVSDNGNGMLPDDALLSIERYATSKLYKDQDLFSIKTLGFRGEALPSIASVSRFSIVTRHKSSDIGTSIIVEGGKIKNVAETGTAPGTMISVRHLFYNIPARRKFLKTINTEMGHILDTVASIALGNPDIQFKLIHNNRAIKNWSVVNNFLYRIVDVVGSDLKKDLHKIVYTDDYVSIEGWISSPSINRSTSQKIFLYINGRFIRDKVISHALFEGYRGRLLKGRYPLAVIFIHIDFDQVDVNVHPTKHEVRFVDQKRVHHVIKNTVKKQLDIVDKSKWTGKNEDYQGQYNPTDKRLKNIETSELSQIQKNDKIKIKTDKVIKEKVLKYRQLQEESSLWDINDNDIINKINSVNLIVENESVLDSSLKPIQNKKKKFEQHNIQASIWKKRFYRDLNIIGQFRNTYILCEAGKDMVLIDQHAAHERILYEVLKKKFENHPLQVQNVLIPETINLNFKETEVIKKFIHEFKKIGFQIENFGGNTFVIKGVPTIIAEKQAGPLIIQIIEKIIELDIRIDFDSFIDECLILTACHGSIRAGQVLTFKQIRRLLEQLDQCHHSSYCPHGRPIWIKYPLMEIEKNFKRIV